MLSIYLLNISRFLKASKKEDINKIKKTAKEVEQQLDKEVYSIYCLSKTEIRVIEELE